MAEDSNVQAADKGMEYQYQVITYIAVSILRNPSIEDFIIYANVGDAGKFDDIVLKIWFFTELHPYIYAVQVKHRTEKPLNISDTSTKPDISSYVKTFKEMMDKQKQIIYLNDVPRDNIKFWFYCSDDIEEIKIYKSKKKSFICDFSKVIYAHETIFPCKIIQKCCYKLHSEEAGDYQEFFDKFYLFLHQPKNNQIGEEIRAIFGVSIPLIKYVEKFFKTIDLCHKGLSKRILEIELLILKLKSHMPTLSKSLGVHTSPAHVWNKLTLEHGITIVGNFEGVERVLYDCSLQKANELFDQIVNWDYYLTTKEEFDEDIIKKFKNLSDGKGFRHWISEPKDVQTLLVELWIYDEVPLVLETNSELSILEQYKHLKKKYVIVSDVETTYTEVKEFYPNIFTNISDILNYTLRDELLQNIFISLQGKKPVCLQSVIGNDWNSMTAFTCKEILNLMKKRNAYLDKNCIKETELIIFIIEDANLEMDSVDIEKILPTGRENIVIMCRNMEKIKNDIFLQIEKDITLKNYSLCWLRSSNNKWEYLKGDAFKLRHFFIDEVENEVYNIGVTEPVSLIGQRLCGRKKLYMPRYLSKSQVVESVFDIQEKRILFLSGDLNSLNSNIKNQVAKYPFDEDTKNKLQLQDTIYIDARDLTEDYWTIFPPERYQLINVKVVNGYLILLEHRNCAKVLSHTTYSKAEFQEDDFAKEIDNKVIVLNGESGIGKSSLLRSLTETSDGSSYVLFCNLSELRDELKLDKKLLQSPLEFIFNRFETSKFKFLLEPIYRYHKRQGKLIIFIDSFDAWCNDTALVFLNEIAQSGINVTIASTFISSNFLMNNLLLNNIKIQPVRINYLRNNDSEEYFKGKGIFCITNSNVMQKIPYAFLLNPLFLKFMYFYYKSDSLDFANINKSDLCKQILMKKIEQFYHSLNQSYVFEDHSTNHAQNEDILEIHRYLALVEMFSATFLETYVPHIKYNKLIKEFHDIKIRLGIVKEFIDDYPIFVNRVFVEFLVKQWFLQTDLDEPDKSEFMKSYNYIANHFLILPEEIEPEEEDSDEF